MLSYFNFDTIYGRTSALMSLFPTKDLWQQMLSAKTLFEVQGLASTTLFSKVFEQGNMNDLETIEHALKQFYIEHVESLHAFSKRVKIVERAINAYLNKIKAINLLKVLEYFVYDLPRDIILKDIYPLKSGQTLTYYSSLLELPSLKVLSEKIKEPTLKRILKKSLKSSEEIDLLHVQSQFYNEVYSSLSQLCKAYNEEIDLTNITLLLRALSLDIDPRKVLIKLGTAWKRFKKQDLTYYQSLSFDSLVELVPTAKRVSRFLETQPAGLRDIEIASRKFLFEWWWRNHYLNPFSTTTIFGFYETFNFQVRDMIKLINIKFLNLPESNLKTYFVRV